MWTMRSGLEIWSDQDGPRSLTAIDVESAGAFSAFFLWMRMRRMQRWAIGSEDIKEGAIMVDGDSKGEGMDRKTEWNMNDKLEGEKTRERRRKKKKKKKERGLNYPPRLVLGQCTPTGGRVLVRTRTGLHRSSSCHHGWI